MKHQNVEKLQNLIKDFYNLTGMKICIYDSQENELCFYPAKLSEFCASVRRSEELDRRCLECDRRAFAVCNKTREQYSYTCHAGLLECVSPVLHDGKIIGYVVIGQIRSNDNSDFQKFLKKIPESGRAALTSAYSGLRTFDEEKISSAMRILDACTGYEYLKSLISKEDEAINVRLDDYIGKNITGDLSVKLLCRVFNLSHSEIYTVFKLYFDTTPAEYVNERRLMHSCRLLRSTLYPINKIAKLSGISDYNYFSKKFKARFGKSPRQFRLEAFEK